MKSIYTVLIILIICVSSPAQQTQAEVTHYVFPEFTSGVVLLKNGLKNNTQLNYNALTEEMVFEDRGQKMVIAENEIMLTDTVFIRDKKFVALNGKFVEYLPFPGWDLFVEYKCRVKEEGKPSAYSGSSDTNASRSVSSFLTGGTIYEINLPGNFRAEPYSYYWLSRNGEINRFINLRQLRKLYKGREDLFNGYVKDHEVKYTDRESMIQLIEYLESGQEM